MSADAFPVKPLDAAPPALLGNGTESGTSVKLPGPVTEPKHRHDKEPAWLKVRKFGGRVMLAAVCTIPVADLALSDAATFKVLEVAQESVHMDSPAVENAAKTGIVAADIMGESMLLGWAITRNRKLKGAFANQEAYAAQRYATMSRPRKALSGVINAPYNALSYVSEKFEQLGNMAANRKSPLARGIGRLAVDTGKVNAIGTSGVILQETLAGNPPDFKRNTWLATLITTTWLGGLKAVQQLYHEVPAVRPPIDVAVKVFETATTPDNPWCISVFGATALGLATTGWREAKFYEKHEQEQAAEGLIVPGAEAQGAA